MKKPTTYETYEVTLRRDVQQIARVRVTAMSPQEALDVAESIDSATWEVEEHIGSHKPEIHLYKAP